MKKLKAILSFVFALGIMCLGFSFASNNYGKVNAFAYSSQIVLENSTFDMAGGTISNAIGDNGGAVYVGDGATFTMTGGKIKNCSATNGGAVYVANGGTFNFDGGTIENCFADLGGAVYVASGGTFNYENNADGFSGCGEDQDLHIYAEEGATVIAPGTPINIYVDGGLSKTITAPAGATTYPLQESDMPLDYENCCGYFYDAKLSQCTNGVIDLTRVESASTFNKRTANAEIPVINIYTRTANPNNFTFIENMTKGTYDIKAKNTSISGNIVLPKEYNNVQTSIAIGTTYGTGAFYNCTSMTGITFQDGLTEVADYTFANLTELKGELIIPDSVISIGEACFSGCGFTGSLIIPDSVVSIGDSAFADSKYFSGYLIIGDGVESIGDFAFYDNSYELELILGNNIKNIGESAFQDNYYITGNLNFTEGLTSLGYCAFAGCPGLTGDLTIPSTLVNMADHVFDECSGLNGTLTIENGISNIGNSAFYRCSGLTGSLTIPDSVTSIGDSAFYSCSGLTSVTIPDSVTSIGVRAFTDCSGLTEVKVTSGNTTYEDRGKNAIIEKSTNTIIQGFNCTDLSVLEEVTSIGNYAFYSCSGLTSVIIPDSVTSIGQQAFYSCSGLTSVYIPSSVTTISAPYYYNAPFYRCSSSLVIYTDASNASSKPSGWGTYWNYYSSSGTLTVNYSYTLEQYKSAVGLTFAPGVVKASGIEVGKVVNSYQIDNTCLQDIILKEKQEYIILPKKTVE
ncbi:MAG: leucine-rich repeat domain-containing protein [Clostridia bacterium]|nr:leucine-rich repeat domain-containing protein [Clostridia bacterium]